MKSVIPWSWSSYEAYQNCPKQYYELKIAKNYTEPPSEPMLWGNEVHKAIEQYIKDGIQVPSTMQRFIPLVDRILERPGDNYAELPLACDVNLQAVGFDSPDAWCRGIGDLVKVNVTKGLNADWKTGKWKDTSLQLDLAGVMTLATFPVLEQVTTLFVYFQVPQKPVSKVIKRADIPHIMAQFADGVRNMEYSQQQNVWPEKPSGLCRRHCPVSTCKYYQKGSPRRY